MMRRHLRKMKDQARLAGGLNARRRFNRTLRSARAKYLPEKYLPGSLSEEDYEAQKNALEASRKGYREGKYVDRPKLKSYRSKESGHVRRAKSLFGVKSMTDFEALEKETGCSREAMENIVKKGKGAYYSSGSRPNQTASSWGLARLASSLTGGPAKKYDMHLLKEGGCNQRVLEAGEKFPWATYQAVSAFLPEAEEKKVSKVARGKGGFMDVYRGKTPGEMKRAMYSNTQSWGRRRRNFLKRHYAQYAKHPTRRRWLAMAMWAFLA